MRRSQWKWCKLSTIQLQYKEESSPLIQSFYLNFQWYNHHDQYPRNSEAECTVLYADGKRMSTLRQKGKAAKTGEGTVRVLGSTAATVTNWKKNTQTSRLGWGQSAHSPLMHTVGEMWITGMSTRQVLLLLSLVISLLLLLPFLTVTLNYSNI